jgi:hypothetical protein
MPAEHPSLQSLPAVRTYGPTNIADCNDFGFGVVPTPATGETSKFATEHLLEFKLLPWFFTSIRHKKTMRNPLNASLTAQNVNLCSYFNTWWTKRFLIVGETFSGKDTPQIAVDWAAAKFPGKYNTYTDELMLLAKDVNDAKEKVGPHCPFPKDIHVHMHTPCLCQPFDNHRPPCPILCPTNTNPRQIWSDGRIRTPTKMQTTIDKTPDEAIKNLKMVLWAFKYCVLFMDDIKK